MNAWQLRDVNQRPHSHAVHWIRLRVNPSNLHPPRTRATRREHTRREHRREHTRRQHTRRAKRTYMGCATYAILRCALVVSVATARGRSAPPVTVAAVPVTASSVNIKTAQDELAAVSATLSTKMERLRTGNQGAHAEYNKAQLAFTKDEQDFATARQKAMEVYERSLRSIVQGLDASNATYTKAASKWQEHLLLLNSSRTGLQVEHDAALSSAAAKLQAALMADAQQRLEILGVQE